MLRRLLIAVTAVAALSFASTASAQGTKLGVGVLTNFQGSAGYVLIPIQVAPQLKVEPMVGINTNDQPTGSPFADTSSISLGTGVFFTQKAAQAADVYFGGRLMLDFVSVDNGVNSESGTNFNLAAAIGGEYFLVPKFSVGVEANLGFYSNADIAGDDSGFFTQGLAIIRFYL